MRQQAASPVLWVLLAVGVAAVLGLGLVFMPRLLAGTTYIPPTPTSTPTPPPPTQESATATSEVVEERPTSEPPTPIPTSALGMAPEFSLPGGKGDPVSLSEQLAKGPVVVIFFPRVGG